MDLYELEIYKIADQISDLAWEVYQDMPQEFKFKTGQQFLGAADSIGANIAEGFGRYHYRDSMRFYYNSRGSLFETDWWINRLLKRSLIKPEKYSEMMTLIKEEKIKLNRFINSIKSKL